MCAKKIKRRSTQSRAIKTKAKILDAALKEFSAGGYEGVSTRAIAKRAAVNHTLITHHFGSKEKLWKAAAIKILETYNEQAIALNKELTDKSEIEKVKALLANFIEYCAKFPDFHRFMIQANQGDSDRLNWFTDHYLKPGSNPELDFFSRAQKLGLIPTGDNVHYRYLFIGATTSIFIYSPQFTRLTGNNPFTDEVIKRHVNYVLSLFRVDAS